MRILQTTPYYAPGWGHGGPPRILYELDKRLVQRGHQVTVYTTDHLADLGRSDKETDVLDGIEVHYFRVPSLWAVNSVAKVLNMPRDYRATLVRTATHFDVIHVAGVRDYLTFNAVMIAKKHGIPYVHSAFGNLPQSGGAVKHLLKVLFDKFIVTDMLRCSSGLMAQTEHEAALYQALGGRRESVSLVPLGVRLPEFEDLPPKGIFRSRFGIAPEKKLIVSLGRIHRMKGFDTLVKAFASVVAEDSNACLAVVGRDEGDLGRLKTLVRQMNLDSYVIFTGPLYDRERFIAYVDADVFALTPGYFEETSLASLEACACGTAVVVTEQAEVPWLTSYDAGFVVKHDVRAVSDALRKSLGDLNTTRARGRNARRMVKDRFEWAVVMSKYEEVLAQAASVGRRSFRCQSSP